MSQPLTVASIVGDNENPPRIYVDGQIVHAPNLTGMPTFRGQSVTVMRIGGGRYQIQSQAGHWAPPPPAP